MGREDHYTGEQDGGQDGPRALAPDFALVGALPPQRVERGDDPQFVDHALPAGELPGQKQYGGDLECFRRLELERTERNPAGGAVGRGADEIDGQRQQNAACIGDQRQVVVYPGVDLVYDDDQRNADEKDQQLLAQEVGRRTSRMRIVGHLRRRGIDHQYGNDGQCRDNDPQHLVPGEEFHAGLLSGCVGLHSRTLCVRIAGRFLRLFFRFHLIFLFRVLGDPLFEQFAPVFVIFEEVEARTGR